MVVCSLTESAGFFRLDDGAKTRPANAQSQRSSFTKVCFPGSSKGSSDNASSHPACHVVAIADRISGAAPRLQRLRAILVMGADNDFNRSRRQFGKFDVETPPGEPAARRFAESRLTP